MNNAITYMHTSSTQTCFLVAVFSTLSLAYSLRVHLATDATYECTQTVHSAFRYAKIPMIQVFREDKESVSATLTDVAIDPAAGAYLVLPKEQCERLGMSRFVGRAGETIALFDGAKITLPDVGNRGLSIQSKVRLGCSSKAGSVPTLGLGGLSSVMSLEAEGDDLYSVLGNQMSSQVKVRRAL